MEHILEIITRELALGFFLLSFIDKFLLILIKLKLKSENPILHFSQQQGVYSANKNTQPTTR